MRQGGKGGSWSRLEFAEYGEWGRFASSVGNPKAKGFQFRGGGTPWTLTKDSTSGVDPAGGLAFRPLLHAHSSLLPDPLAGF